MRDQIAFQAARAHARSDRLKQRFHGEEFAMGWVTKARMKANVPCGRAGSARRGVIESETGGERQTGAVARAQPFANMTGSLS